MEINARCNQRMAFLTPFTKLSPAIVVVVGGRIVFIRNASGGCVTVSVSGSDD
jgi:hypothetical protein